MSDKSLEKALRIIAPDEAESLLTTYEIERDALASDIGLSLKIGSDGKRFSTASQNLDYLRQFVIDQSSKFLIDTSNVSLKRQAFIKEYLRLINDLRKQREHLFNTSMDAVFTDNDKQIDDLRKDHDKIMDGYDKISPIPAPTPEEIQEVSDKLNNM